MIGNAGERVGETAEGGGRTRPVAPASWKDAVGLAWVVLAGLAVLVPALSHGASLGSYDIMGQFGVTAHPGQVHDALLNDVINQMIPWTSLAWTQVHAGHLPLWNPYVVTGTPLAFNWQSSAFSPPALVSYLVPLRLAYTCQVLLTLVIAGTGAYVCGRVLRLGVLACTLAGVAFELSGPFVSWLGWPIASVASWTGWVLAGLVLVLRGGHRARAVVLTGFALACAVLAGQPDALVLLVMASAVFVLVMLGVRWARDGSPTGLVRPVIDLALCAVLGVLLSAPLLLPGLQTVSHSVRAANGAGGLNAQHAIALPILLNGYAFGLVGFPNLLDFQYIGAAVVALAAGAVLLRRRSGWVLALAAVGVLGLLLTYVNPADVLVNALPGLHAVRLPRADLFLGFATAVLAGAGLQLLVTTARPAAHRVFGVLFLVAGSSLAVVWATGYRKLIGFDELTAPSYLWAAGSLLMGLAVVGLAVTTVRKPVAIGAGDTAARPIHRRWRDPVLARRAGGIALIVLESVFLVVAGSSVWTATPGGTPHSPAAQRLEHIVGGTVVGLGASQCHPDTSELGFAPNTNILYGVRQFAAYDPLLPQRLYTSWTANTGQSPGYPQFSHFCPAITSVALARRYGVSYVLEPGGAPGPPGTRLVATIAGEALFAVPDVHEATATALGAGGRLPSDSDPGSPVAVSHPDPATWHLTTRSATAQVVRLRLTDVPGWHASIDGRPLRLVRWDGVMLQAVVPPGAHRVAVWYRPAAFDLGIVLAAFGLLAAVVGLAWGPVRRRLRPGG